MGPGKKSSGKKSSRQTGSGHHGSSHYGSSHQGYEQTPYGQTPDEQADYVPPQQAFYEQTPEEQISIGKVSSGKVSYGQAPFVPYSRATYGHVPSAQEISQQRGLGGNLEPVPEHKESTFSVSQQYESGHGDFVDVPGALDALNEFVESGPSHNDKFRWARGRSKSIERPPSRRGASSDQKSASFSTEAFEKKQKAIGKEPVAVGQSTPARYHRRQSSGALATQPWSSAFRGSPRSASNPQPGAFPPGTAPQSLSPSEQVPCVGSGQVTYVGQTEFNAEMQVTIFWEENIVWGKFNIPNPVSWGWLSHETVENRNVMNDQTVEFHWRGCCMDTQVPHPKLPSECTKVTIQFLKRGRKIKGRMHPIGKTGRMDWHKNTDGEYLFLDHHFKFSGTASPGIMKDSQAAFDDWETFGSGQ